MCDSMSFKHLHAAFTKSTTGFSEMEDLCNLTDEIVSIEGMFVLDNPVVISSANMIRCTKILINCTICTQNRNFACYK